MTAHEHLRAEGKEETPKHPASSTASRSPLATMLAMQRAAGNAAVCGLLLNRPTDLAGASREVVQRDPDETGPAASAPPLPVDQVRTAVRVEVDPRARTNRYVFPLGPAGSFDQLIITLDGVRAYQPISPGDELHATALRVELRAREPGVYPERRGGFVVRRPILPGDTWRIPQLARVSFTAHRAEQQLAGERRVPGDPGTVTNTAIGLGNIYAVTSRRSGATEHVLTTFVAQGSVHISMDIDRHDLAWLLGSSGQPLPFVYERRTSTEQLEDQVRSGPGVGVNIGGWDPENSTHIISPALERGISQAQGPRH